MVHKLNILGVTAALLALVIAVQACIPVSVNDVGTPVASSAVLDIPTWTPRASALSPVLPTASILATITPTAFIVQNATPELPRVTMLAINGNLNVRRGPSVNYNSIGVLYTGEKALASGRDLVSRWLLVEIPSAPGTFGWVSMLTNFTLVVGDVEALPVVTVAPALPAFIRNCTLHTMRVMPTDVQLLPRDNSPYNEQQFAVGIYQVYDLDVSDKVSILEINLREGITVDILKDGTGSKLKCK